MALLYLWVSSTIRGKVTRLILQLVGRVMRLSLPKLAQLTRVMMTTLLPHLLWMSIWCAKLVFASILSVHKFRRSGSKSGMLPILISAVPCLGLFVIWTMLSFGHTKAMVPRPGKLSVLCMLEQIPPVQVSSLLWMLSNVYSVRLQTILLKRRTRSPCRLGTSATIG